MRTPWKLKDISLKELEQELQRRNFSFAQEKNILVPLQLDSPNFADVIKLCQEYINDIIAQGWPGDDRKNHVRVKTSIVLAAMIAIFGPDIWDWIEEYIEHDR